MRSNCVVVAALAALLLILGSSTGLKQESAGSSPDPALESTTGVGSTSPVSEAGPATVAGIWSLVLIDGATGRSSSVEADISQIDRVIFGRGALGGAGAAPTFLPVETGPRPTRDDGIKSMVWWLHQDPAPAAQGASSARYLTIGASGIVIGQRVNLDLIFLDQNALYRLDLTVFGSSVSGDYLAYEAGGAVGSGSCLGSIRPGYALPLSSSPEVLNLGRMR